MESEVKTCIAVEGYLVEKARCVDKHMMEIRFSCIW